MTGDPRYPIDCLANFIVDNYPALTYDITLLQSDRKIIDKQQNFLEFTVEEFIQLLGRDLTLFLHVIHFSLPARHADSNSRTQMTRIDVLSRSP
ncbi:hypothetical protein WT33_15975 [Burkholderia stagnalis]|nr:hypothetical protein WT33_15975 [Burkholderia stagnalis]